MENLGSFCEFASQPNNDPAEKTIVAPPLHADARLLAYPERDPDRQRRQFIAGQRAYSSSKLCNLLTARALAAHPDLSPALRLTLRGSNTPEAAGECLAKLALGQTRPPSGRIYAALRSGTITWPALDRAAGFRAPRRRGRGKFLRQIAAEVNALGDELIQVCHEETSLDADRLRGERSRTTNQLEMFAELIEEGSWVDARSTPPCRSASPC